MKTNNLINKFEILEKKQKFIERGFIYFLIFDEKIIYVGQARIPFYRIKQHYVEKKIIFNYFTIIEVNKKYINNIEKNYIIKYKPKYNKKHNKINTNKINMNKKYISVRIEEKYFNILEKLHSITQISKIVLLHNAIEQYFKSLNLKKEN